MDAHCITHKTSFQRHNQRPQSEYITLLVHYTRQVNAVNGADNVFIQRLSVCLSVCLCAVDQSIKLVVDNFIEIPSCPRTPNLATMFPGTVPTWPLKFVQRGHAQRQMISDPLKIHLATVKWLLVQKLSVQCIAWQHCTEYKTTWRVRCPVPDVWSECENFKWPYLSNASSDRLRVWFYM